MEAMLLNLYIRYGVAFLQEQYFKNRNKNKNKKMMEGSHT